MYARHRRWQTGFVADKGYRLGTGREILQICQPQREIELITGTLAETGELAIVLPGVVVPLRRSVLRPPWALAALSVFGPDLRIQAADQNVLLIASRPRRQQYAGAGVQDVRERNLGAAQDRKALPGLSSYPCIGQPCSSLQTR
jgi:hypothetical protein